MATQNAIGTTIPIPVASGGTGAITETAHSLILGQGTSAFTALGAATNGQIPIGSTGADPVLATITQGTGITVTNGAGTITIAASGGGVTSLAGNSGGALTGALSLVTSNATNTFVGSGTTITQNFAATNNVVIGSSLPSLSGGTFNTGLGTGVLAAVAGGGSNTAVGGAALNTISAGAQNVGIGGGTVGSAYAGTESNNILIGYGIAGTQFEGNVCRIGNGTGTGAGQLNKFFGSGITGITVTGTAILISAGNQLGIAVSSQKFKLDVQDMRSDTDFIYKLRPVTFVWDKTANEGLHDAPDARQYGLIAEEVVKIQPELVGFDKQGDPLNVHYDRLVPMLLNEIQRLEKRITALEAK